MKISDVCLTAALGGFFHDDLAAVVGGAARDGQHYPGSPRSPGFTAIRQPARAAGIGLVLSSGAVVWGDTVSVQYAGAGGRDGVFVPPPGFRDTLREALCGLPVDGFRTAMAAVRPNLAAVSGHPALAFGLSQALLAAAAQARGGTMCEVLCAEYGLPVPDSPVPIYAQSGDDFAGGVDKMILKRVDALPHGLVNNREKFGPEGRTLLDRIAWTAERIRLLAPEPEYRPVLHFDVYGLAGLAFDGDLDRVAQWLARAARAARPFRLRVESPLDLGSRDRQIEGLARLRARVRRLGVPVAIVADEWCNTLEDIEDFAAAGACDMVQIKMPDLGGVDHSLRAVLHCREIGMQSLLGGSCTETEVSARVAVHVALAGRPDVQLAKPGMGVDEGLMIVANEQARTLAALAVLGESRDRAEPTGAVR